ncbi:MAG: hypothetical protein ABMA26_16930 [Limisphaerales bacterium]
MKLNDPPDPLIEQALDKFAAEQGLTRIPRATLSPPSADSPFPVAAQVEPQPDSAKLIAAGVISALKEPHTEAHDKERT